MNSRVVKEKLYKAFDRPGLRFLIAYAASAFSSLRTQQPCWVQYEEKKAMWIQQYAKGVLVEPRLRLRVLPQIENNIKAMYLFEYTPQLGDVVLDIGAGTGWETLYFSRLVGPSGRVLSVEAHPRTFACLKEMCRRNHLRNVLLVHGAVASENGQAVISDDEHQTANTIVDTKDGIEVKAVSLNTLIESAGYDRVDFLKMNIEGAERLALDGMYAFIRQVRHLCISCHDFLADRGGPEQMRTTKSVISFLEQNGFNHIRRPAHPWAWVRDCVYAHNRQFESLGSAGKSGFERKCTQAPSSKRQINRNLAWKENV